MTPDAARSMRTFPLTFALFACLSGCGGQVPGFLGRNGDPGTYSIRGDRPEAPDPVALALTQAEVEASAFGVILRVNAIAPTQGYHGLRLVPPGNPLLDVANIRTPSPDPAGTLVLRLEAIPPAAAQAIGPPRTRTLTVAEFIPTRGLKSIRAVRVEGGSTARTLALPSPPIDLDPQTQIVPKPPTPPPLPTKENKGAPQQSPGSPSALSQP